MTPVACPAVAPCYFDNTAGFVQLAELVHGWAAYTVVLGCLVLFFVVLQLVLLFVLVRR